MKNAIRQIGLLLLVAGLPPSARADLYSDFVKSLEWMIDASDVIVVIEITQQDRQKVARTESVFKNAGKRDLKDWPHSELARLAADLPKGRQLLVFGRCCKDDTPDVLDLICLSEAAPPKGMSLREAQCKAATDVGDDRAKLGICAAINRHGKLLTSPAQVLDMVKQRVGQGSRVPADCNRELVEKPYGGDEYGGRWRSGSECDTREICYSVLAPWDPEDLKGLLNELRRVTGTSKALVARQLANFRTAESIAALKACLDDDFIWRRVEDDVWVSSYEVRAAAYQSLCKTGVKLLPPKLRPD